RFSMDSRTCSTSMAERSGDERIAEESAFQGPQISGSDAPKNTSDGTPKAAAIWAGPLSFPIKSFAPERIDMVRRRGALEMQRNSVNSARLSPGPAMNKGSRSRLSRRCRAIARKFAALQVFSGLDAFGWRIA